MSRLPSAVLFACTMNAIRSPIAEAWLKHLHGSRIFVDSCGVRPDGAGVDPFAVAVMDEVGIELGRHRPKSFQELEDTSFDLVVSLSPEAQHSAVELTRTAACELEFWPVFDATAVEGSREAKLEAYRSVRDALRRRIVQRFPLPPGAHL
jgi:protein-tyrosine-phosphatase